MTIVKAEKPCNKYVHINRKTGEVIKDGASNITQATAKTYHVPTLEAMHTLMITLSEQPKCALINGFVRGTEDGTPYQISKANRRIHICEI
jgi:hypothetical protein